MVVVVVVDKLFLCFCFLWLLSRRCCLMVVLDSDDCEVLEVVVVVVLMVGEV